MIRKIFKYRDRDDEIELDFNPGPNGKWQWTAVNPETHPDEPGKGRCMLCGPGKDSYDEAYADACRLLNVMGEDET